MTTTTVHEQELAAAREIVRALDVISVTTRVLGSRAPALSPGEWAAVVLAREVDGLRITLKLTEDERDAYLTRITDMGHALQRLPWPDKDPET